MTGEQAPGAVPDAPESRAPAGDRAPAWDPASPMTVVNATPVPIIVGQDGAGDAVSIGPLEERPIVAHGTGTALRAWLPASATCEADREPGLQLASPRAVWTIGPRDLPAMLTGPATPAAEQVAITNDSESYARVTCTPPGGAGATTLAEPLAPQETRSHQVAHGTLVQAFATLSDELLGACVCEAGGPTFVFDEEYRRAYLRKVVPSPGPGHDLRLVGQPRTKPDATSRDYVSVSTAYIGLSPLFNGRDNVLTRQVVITGVDLRWDASDTSGINIWGADPETLPDDVKDLVVCADRVTIAVPLRFPGTHVTINARELVIEAWPGSEPAISTEPLPHPPAPVPRAAVDPTTGNLRVSPANGRPGQDGGDVTLNVGSVRAARAQRGFLRTRGGAGQRAESGGLLPYVPKSGKPAKDDPKDLNPITQKHVEGSFKHAFMWYTSVRDWTWSDEQPPDALTYEGSRIFAEGHVVRLRVWATDDLDVNTFTFPGGARMHMDNVGRTSRFAPTEAERLAIVAELKAGGPHDGESAYPGGSPGNGGKGGTIRTTPLPGNLTFNTAGGPAGPETAAVAGGAPGAPYPAYAALGLASRPGHLAVVYREHPGPWTVVDVSANRGAAAESLAGTPGGHGAMEAIERRPGEPPSWIQAEGLEVFIAFAADLHRNGYPADARRVVDPYWAYLSEAATYEDQLASLLPRMRALRARLVANRDYYGNPPGWVPRLGLASNYQYFRSMRQAAQDLYYESSGLLEAVQARGAAAQLAVSQADALKADLDVQKNALREACTGIANKQAELIEIADELAGCENAIGNVKAWVSSLAMSDASKQRVFTGIMKIAGGGMSALPWGQPVVGMVGGMVSSAGDTIDITGSSSWAQSVSATAQKAGETLKADMARNKDFLIENALSDTAKKKRGTRLETIDVEAKLREIGTRSEWEREQLEKATKDALAKQKPERDKAISDITKNAAQVEREIGVKVPVPKADPESAGAVTIQLEDVQQARARLEDRAASLEKEIEAAKEQMVGAMGSDQAKLVADTVASTKLAPVQKAAEALAGEQRRAAALKTALEDKAKTLDIAGEDQQQARKATLNSLSGVGQGLASVGTGIGLIFGDVDAKDPEVVKRAAELLADGDAGKEYQELSSTLASLGKRQDGALLELERLRHAAATASGSLTAGLNEIHELSLRRQRFGAARDGRTERYLRDMKVRALDALREAVYFMVMAYRYEALEDLPDDFYNIDKLDRLVLEKAGKGDKVADLDKGDFRKACDLVLSDQLVNTARTIVAKRNSDAAGRANTVSLALRDDDLETLQTTGLITINLVEIYAEQTSISERMQQLLICDITNPALTLELTDRPFTPRLTFSHSGISIVHGATEWFFFQKAPEDAPISWGFQTSLPKPKPVRAADDAEPIQTDDAKSIQMTVKEDDLTSSGLDDIVTDALKTDKLAFREYHPSMLGDITIALRLPDDPWPPAGLAAIRALTFDVTYRFTPGR
jgi:hypothetical protein